MAYNPKPLDTSGINLSPEILELTELLARHSHDVWAQRRLEEGWRYGANRDDSRKEHPCLVPYEQLLESERQYDRYAALQTLKVTLALGYKISKS